MMFVSKIQISAQLILSSLNKEAVSKLSRHFGFNP